LETTNVDLEAVLAINTFDRAVVIRDSETNDIEVGFIFSYIQDAIDDIAEYGEGDTVEVSSGTYDGGITVNVGGLTIKSAEGPENIIVKTGEHGDTIPDLAFSIRAHNVTVSGIGIEHSDNGADGIGILLAPGSNYTTIENNIIVNKADATKGLTGAYLADGDAGHEVTVHNNYFSNWRSAVGGTEDTQPTITENVFQNNRNSIGLAASAANIVIGDNVFNIDDVSALETAFGEDARYISNRGLTEAEAEAIVDSTTGNTFDPAARFAIEGDNTSNIVPEGSGEIVE